MNRLLLALCLAACLVACGGSSSGYVPVDSPLTPFQPPDTEDLVSADEVDGEDASADEDADDDWGAVDDENDGGDAASGEE